MLVAGLAVTVSCSVPAYQKIDQQAEQAGLQRATVQGRKFRHVVYSSIKSNTDTIHIYIEGDGANWKWNRVVKADPTPQRSLMLDLMSTDRGNVLYLGRPCYLGLELDDACDADHWTYERYSEQVVSSMVEVIKAQAGHFKKVVLIGHSGGGALALLIAEHLSAVSAVVTIAGIIDTDAWTAHHGHTRLVGTLNPAKRSSLPDKIKQLHLVGGRDANIPPALVRQWINRQPGVRLWEVPGNSHTCCWNKNWPAVLLWIASSTGRT